MNHVSLVVSECLTWLLLIKNFVISGSRLETSFFWKYNMMAKQEFKLMDVIYSSNWLDRYVVILEKVNLNHDI